MLASGVLQNDSVIYIHIYILEASLVTQTVKYLLAMQETQVQSLGWEDPLKEEMVTQASILAWEIPQTEEPSRLQSTGLQRFRHNLAT